MFTLAKPVWLRDLGHELNSFAAFRLRVPSLGGALLRLSAATFYRLTVNGRFVAFGPARTAGGYARVDELPLDAYACPGENELVIEVAGYNCRSLSTVLQHPFLQAELCRGDEVLACTGRDFDSFHPRARVRKTERYSFQRHFSEVWDFASAPTVTEEADRHPWQVLESAPTPLPRRAPYPHYEECALKNCRVRGSLVLDPQAPYRMDKFSEPITPRWGRYEHGEIDRHPFRWVQQLVQTPAERGCPLPLSLGDMEYAVFDFDRIEVGFLQLAVRAEEDTELVVAFSEYCPDDTFVYTPMNVQNTVTFLLGRGQQLPLSSFEPYTFRFVMVAVSRGRLCLEGMGLRRFERVMTGAPRPPMKTPVLDRVYNGALRTFAHNAVDLYTDCPSRERAGWLCDSYFTGRAEYALFGETPVEDAFLENYALFPGDGALPEGALPMCYPADLQDDSKFIPQWTMWYILEVEEYVNRRGHRDMAELFRSGIYGLLAFYRRYENGDGLLEDLPSWNFVEWSRANSWTRNVNYPTNFLYSEVLLSIDRLYGDPQCRRLAQRVREAAASQAFNGTLFVDHALRDDQGRLIPQEDISEIGQYYAILFGGIDLTEPRYDALYRMITHDFVPDSGNPRDPRIEQVNAFIGVYLRLEALSRLGEREILLGDIENFFGRMEAYTGTLWEYREFKGSYDHGFASYVASLLLEHGRRE